ncbi:MAG: RNA-binding protein [Shimia sp.]
MTRSAATKERGTPERMCLVTRESGGKVGLIRFVTSPDGMVVPDILGKLPGRGYYVTAERSVLEEAVKRKVFARGAKGPVTIPDGLVDLIEQGLARQTIHLIALARKAGHAISGFEKVKSALADRGDVKVLMQASDGSTRGKGKLWTPTGARYFGCLTADELGQAFDRGQTIHAVITTGGLAERIVETAAKLNGLRGRIGASGAGKE